MTLEQLWSLTDGRGIRVHAENSVSILSGRAIYLPSKEWSKIVLPYKVSVIGGVTLLCGLQRPGLVAGLTITKGGQMKVNMWNSTEETVHLTPKIVLVNVVGSKIKVKNFGKEAKWVGHIQCSGITSECIK